MIYEILMDGQTLYYPGDDWSGDFEHWRQFYNADQAIVLLSDFLHKILWTFIW